MKRSTEHCGIIQLPTRRRNQRHILRIARDLVALAMHHQLRRRGITQRMQLHRMLVDEIRLAGHMDRRDPHDALQAMVVDDVVGIVLAKGWQRANEDGAAEKRAGRVVGVLLCVLR